MRPDTIPATRLTSHHGNYNRVSTPEQLVAANMARDIGFPDPTGQWPFHVYFRASLTRITGEFPLREDWEQFAIAIDAEHVAQRICRTFQQG